jgi:hypothetical protein
VGAQCGAAVAARAAGQRPFGQGDQAQARDARVAPSLARQSPIPTPGLFPIGARENNELKSKRPNVRREPHARPNRNRRLRLRSWLIHPKPHLRQTQQIASGLSGLFAPFWRRKFTESVERSKSGLVRTVSGESRTWRSQSGLKRNFGEGARSPDA